MGQDWTARGFGGALFVVRVPPARRAPAAERSRFDETPRASKGKRVAAFWHSDLSGSALQPLLNVA